MHFHYGPKATKTKPTLRIPGDLCWVWLLNVLFPSPSRLFILSLRLSLQFWRFVMQISAPAPLCPRVISHLCSNRCVQEQPWSGSKWWQLALYHSTEPSQVTHRWKINMTVNKHVNICLHKTVRVFDVTKEKKHPLHSPNSSIFT